MFMIQNKIQNNHGFTLIEVLVGINLSFIILTLLISVFLIMLKFVITSTKKYDERENQVTAIYRIEELIKKRNNISIISGKNNSTILIFDNRDTVVLSSNKITINNGFTLDNIEELSLKIKQDNEMKTIPASLEPISTNELNDIVLTFKQNGIKHEYLLEVPFVSSRNFPDLDFEK